MPIPKTQDIGKIIRFLKKEKPNISNKQKIAIAISQAREAGADISEKQSNYKRSDHQIAALKRKMKK